MNQNTGNHECHAVTGLHQSLLTDSMLQEYEISPDFEICVAQVEKDSSAEYTDCESEMSVMKVKVMNQGAVIQSKS